MQNHFLLKSADKRLNKANEMVITLAHSADQLSSSISELKDMMVHLETVYTSRNDMLIKNRDDFKDSYIKLLKKYEIQEQEIKELQKLSQQQNLRFADEILHTIQEIARKPTITNNPISKEPRL